MHRQSYRGARRISKQVAYFEKTDSLPDSGFLHCAMLVPFYHNKVLMLETPDKSLRFPCCTIEEEEALRKTLRRELHRQTGAVLYSHTFLGQFAVYDLLGTAYLPVYVGKISHLEKLVSENRLLELPRAIKSFAPHWEKPNIEYFLHALNSYRKSKRKV